MRIDVCLGLALDQGQLPLSTTKSWWSAQQRFTNPPHCVAFNSVAVFDSGCNRDAVARLAEVRQHVSADLELGLIEGRVPVGGPVYEAELSAVGGIRAMHVHRERDCHVNVWTGKPSLPTFQELVLLGPLGIDIHPDPWRLNTSSDRVQRELRVSHIDIETYRHVYSAAPELGGSSKTRP